MRRRRRRAVCNAYGHDVAAAEYAVLGMLAWSHELLPAHQSFRAGSWRMSGRYGAPPHEEVHGKTVGVLGLGPIGVKTARLAHALGARVIACNRSQRAHEASIEQLHPLARVACVPARMRLYRRKHCAGAGHGRSAR